LLKGEEKMDTSQAVNSGQKGSSWARFSNGLHTYLRKPENIILLVCGIMLTVMILAPTITLFTDSFVIHTGNESLISELKPGTVTTYSWHYAFADMLSEGEFYKPLGRSLLVGVIACAFALAFGGITAWLVTRTNMPCKQYISTIFIFPYIMPQWTLATIWQYLFWSKKVDSTANGILANWGIFTPKWFNEGLFPTALILGIHYAAFAYIMIGTVFKNMDSNLEEAATILNTPKWKIFLKITIPMITPAILSTVLLVFSNAIGSYPVPYYLHYPDLAVKYLENLHDAPGFTSIIAMVMSAIGLAILYLNVLSSKSRKQYTTVTGKAGQVEPTKLGKINRWIVAIILIIATAFTAIYPVIAFAIQTFLPNPNDFSSGLTTIWWTNKDLSNSKVMNEMGILYNSHIWTAFGNTIKTGLLCSLFAGTIGMLVGYAVSKQRKSNWAQYVNSMAFLPYLIPSLSVGAAYYVLGGKMQISGTLLLMVLVGTLKYIPFSSRASLNAMSQLSGEIEEAAVIQNANWFKRMWKIIIPIQKSSFISGYSLPFITCTREYSLFVMLATNDACLLTIQLKHFDDIGLPAMSSACNLIIIVFVLLANLLVQFLTGSRLDGGVSGGNSKKKHA
jgi:iron(III) transport system permease protein